MEENCNNCKTQPNSVTMSELAYEAHEARHERRERRLWIALIVSVALLFASNMGWLIYESQFETYYYEQDGEGLNNINTGTQGDVLNEPTTENEKKEENGTQG